MEVSWKVVEVQEVQGGGRGRTWGNVLKHLWSEQKQRWMWIPSSLRRVQRSALAPKNGCFGARKSRLAKKRAQQQGVFLQTCFWTFKGTPNPGRFCGWKRDLFLGKSQVVKFSDPNLNGELVTSKLGDQDRSRSLNHLAERLHFKQSPGRPFFSARLWESATWRRFCEIWVPQTAENFFGSEGKNGRLWNLAIFGETPNWEPNNVFQESSTTTVHHMNWFQLAGGFIPILLNFCPETLGLHDPIFR